MRVLVLVLAVLAVSCGANSIDWDLQKPIAGGAQSDADGGQLVGLLEKVKGWLKNGHDKPKIPVLDPLKMEHVELNIHNNEMGIVVEGALDNLRAIGLSDFVVNKGDFELIGLQVGVDLSWKSLDFFTMYNLIKAKIQPPPILIHGEGAVIALAKELQVAVDAKLSMNDDGNLYVKQINLKIQLGSFDFNASGLFNDEELSKMISKIISDLVPGVLRDYPEMISKKGGELLKEQLDKILSTLTLKDLMDMINSSNENNI